MKEENLEYLYKNYNKEFLAGENISVNNSLKDNLKIIENSNLDIDFFKFDLNEYKKYLKEVDYQTNYPNYIKTCNIEEKTFQHYLSLKLINLASSKTCIDIASSNSPFCRIIEKLYPTAKIFRQDIQYETDLENNNKIGGSVDKIDLDDNFSDALTLHCSIEHFEADADINFFKEASRILRKDGIVCITPIYLVTSKAILTSPSVWQNKYKNLDTLPIFSKDFPIIINENIKQRQIKLFDINQLIKDIVEPFKEFFQFKIVVLENYEELEKEGYTKYPKFTLIAKRK